MGDNVIDDLGFRAADLADFGDLIYSPRPKNRHCRAGLQENDRSKVVLPLPNRRNVDPVAGPATTQRGHSAPWRSRK
jgi:hypothetical protein